VFVVQIDSHRFSAAAGDLLSFMKVVIQGTDAVYDPQDVLPFLGLHYVQVQTVLRLWEYCTFSGPYSIHVHHQ
jgi:hypothetical protein